MYPSRRAAHRTAQLTYEYSLFAPADVTAPRLCRDFVRTVLSTHDREHLITPAALCTSELVTNVHLTPRARPCSASASLPLGCG